MQPHGGTASPHGSEAANSLSPDRDWRPNWSPLPNGTQSTPSGQSQPAWRFLHRAEQKVGRGRVGPVCGGGGGGKKVAAQQAAGFVVTCL